MSLMDHYRPRGTLARAIFEKYHNDNYLDQYDTKLWYKLNQKLPEPFQAKFIAFVQPDDITVNWLERAKLLSANIWLHVWHVLASSFLKIFMTQTDINGFLKRGSMFILSEQQFNSLLHAGGIKLREHELYNMLDIGAGDGEITLRVVKSLQSMARNVCINTFATETSWTMRNRLKKLNFTVLERINEVQNVQLILCLNVLDRCADPIELLQQMHKALAADGHLVVALVLPYFHYVEANSSHLPVRPLMPHKTKQLSFEAEALIFFELLQNMGFCVEAWTKAPYLCEGDLRQSFYWLIDLVVVLSKKTI